MADSVEEVRLRIGAPRDDVVNQRVERLSR
jgi:hypothetical protein